MDNWRAKAPRRKRPRRIQKKIDKRGGRMHFSYDRKYKRSIPPILDALTPYMNECIKIVHERIALDREMVDIMKGTSPSGLSGGYARRKI